MIDLKNTWYFQYQDQYFFNLRDVLDHLKKDYNKAYFNFYDDIFQKYDWSQEPVESFEELKKIRAQQIRDKYRYVRLFVSYGSDSGTMVNSFIRNNLFIDEVVNYVSVWENNLTDLEQEHNTLFLPNIREFIKTSPNTKVTLKKITALDAKAMLSVVDKNLVGIVPSRFNLAKLDNELTTDRNVIDVIGDNKPYIFIESGKFYTRFSFLYVHDWIGHTTDGVDNFFTTPECPKLHIKQCHLLKNKIKKERPELINQSYIKPIHLFETSLFDDGTSMEHFIEMACRDYTDYGLALLKTPNSFYIKGGSINKKEMARARGFYKSNPQLLTDYLDYVRDYLSQPIFKKNYKNELYKDLNFTVHSYYLGR
jgi:hypothetical protein